MLYNGRQMAAPIWPGKHMVMVVTGTAPPTIQLVQLNVSAGKTYVIGAAGPFAAEDLEPFVA